MKRWIATRLLLVVIGTSIPFVGAKVLQQFFGTERTDPRPPVVSSPSVDGFEP